MAKAKTSTVDKAVMETVKKTAFVVVLPPMSRLPRGHVLIAAVHGDTVAGVRDYEVTNEAQMAAKLLEVMSTSSANGYEVEILVSARVNYKNTVRTFKNDAMAEIEYVRNYQAPMQAQQQQEQEDDLPF